MARVASAPIAPSRRLARSGKAMPASIEPMLATASTLPPDQSAYSFEFKWDGVRALAFHDGAHLKLQGRAGNDITMRYPELHRLGEALGRHRAILDGEIVALDDVDRPDFTLLQQRMHLSDPLTIERVSKKIPVLYAIFDLLWLDGRSLMGQPLVKRRELLETLTLAGASWHVSPARSGAGTRMLQAARDNQLEGIVAKRLDSTYTPGARSLDWLKIKLTSRQEFVVGGWTGGSVAHRDIGALLVGYYEQGKLHYAGRVGSGLTRTTLQSLGEKLGPLVQPASPFVDPVPGAGAKPGRWARPVNGVHFVQPKLVVEVEFRRWPVGGSIQHASFKGLRTDKKARDVVKETFTLA